MSLEENTTLPIDQGRMHLLAFCLPGSCLQFLSYLL